jgi:hypothetical protein
MRFRTKTDALRRYRDVIHPRIGHLLDPALDPAARAGSSQPPDDRKIYDPRDTFGTIALAAGVQPFELSRFRGTSVRMIDATYGHLSARIGRARRRPARRRPLTRVERRFRGM